MDEMLTSTTATGEEVGGRTTGKHTGKGIAGIEVCGEAR